MKQQRAPLGSVDEVLQILAASADVADDPSVDLLTHSLQCGAILRHSGDLELAVAGLVHDIADAVDPDDHSDHDVRGAALVRDLFGERVARLVGAHVVAKRYLVATEPQYRKGLSLRSAETLALQGEGLDRDQMGRLRGDPDFEAIISLRRADERAKDPDVRVPDLETWQRDLALVAGSIR
jgi:predicted HD phosphohydrolase